jgi:Zn-dependent metalloprotease
MSCRRLKAGKLARREALMGSRASGLLLMIPAAAVAISAAQDPRPAGPSAAGVIAVTAQNRASLREWDATLDRMVRSAALSRRKIHPDTLVRGRSHERYDQYFEGVRVIGGDVSRQLAGGSTESIVGRLHAVTGVSTQPTLADEDARRRFEALATAPPRDPLELVILPTDDGGYALAYRAHIWVDRMWMQTYLDAHNGEVLLQYNDLQTQAAIGSGIGVLGDTKKISARPAGGRYLADDAMRPPVLITYDMQGDLDKTERFLSGFYFPTTSDIANDNDNKWTDGANVDAHVHLGWTYDYYFKRFGRRGLDDNNAPIYAVTHPIRRADVPFLPAAVRSLYATNAFWCTGCGWARRGAIAFGEGAGFLVADQSWDYLAGALDVVAHELTHGLTAYSSGLIYRNESGALNEAFSDILGTGAEFFYHSAGTGARRADYLVAEDVVTAGGIRSMSSPADYGDPDHYAQRFTGSADNGGVHTNSAIASQAFYLAIEGGVNRTSGVSVQGVGGGSREQIEKVFYRAFVFMLPSSATFSTARAATVQAARDLYGAGSAAERAVMQAWTAVGVE